ncbi:extracellular solute-binding protein [Siccirubricoccus phaeus]|uniref:extracellular solute-binding protein n=1 Tax=Siccirubricoccus phaeus TaxID=2595053 RepID=UPI0011F1AAF0|nr:extracellular solute-binding protein [Siccirubricoccus phaeus]
MTLFRRSVLAGAATLLPAPLLLRAARAADGKVVMASWGGGGARMWREVFAVPFQKESGVETSVVEVPDPAAAVAAAQGRPQHNAIVAASYQAANLARRGLIEEFDEADLPAIQHIPEQYRIRNTAGKLLGMPIYFIYYGIAFNSTLARAADFASWHALKDRKWRDQLSITRPLFLGPYDLTLYAKLNGGDEANIQPGVPMLEAVAKNAISVYTSMASLQQQLSRGEVTAAPFYSGQIQMLRREGQKEVNITLPREGGLVLSYILSVPKGAQDKAAALRYLNACIAPEKQVGAAQSGYLPLAANASLPAALEAELGMTMAEVREKNWSPNWYTIAADLEQRIRLTEQIIDRAR